MEVILPTVNSCYLEVEVHSKLLYLKENFLVSDLQ